MGFNSKRCSFQVMYALTSPMNVRSFSRDLAIRTTFVPSYLRTFVSLFAKLMWEKNPKFLSFFAPQSAEI